MILVLIRNSSLLTIQKKELRQSRFLIESIGEMKLVSGLFG